MDSQTFVDNKSLIQLTSKTLLVGSIMELFPQHFFSLHHNKTVQASRAGPTEETCKILDEGITDGKGKLIKVGCGGETSANVIF